MIVNKCDSCVHKDVCRYKDEYQKIRSKYSSETPNSIFNLELDCPNYSQPYVFDRFTYIDRCSKSPYNDDPLYNPLKVTC